MEKTGDLRYRPTLRSGATPSRSPPIFLIDYTYVIAHFGEPYLSTIEAMVAEQPSLFGLDNLYFFDPHLTLIVRMGAGHVQVFLHPVSFSPLPRSNRGVYKPEDDFGNLVLFPLWWRPDEAYGHR
ncbi:hypothetical protein Y032_0195g1464 [Ancylostoma ceylanicum]|uniref:Uncharacterized protein n=1 Tax=Ancylostoma ceylanicum TaxID=53326 RepID=A0A016SNL9_9BILA|nr:hypothetical protein Y032_0195g1464 [Ancylostoma ceylanicum]